MLSGRLPFLGRSGHMIVALGGGICLRQRKMTGRRHHPPVFRETPGLASEPRADAFVAFEHVQKSYDGVSLVVKDLNLTIAKGEFLTMLGPSGSGKTTCLMMLAGF